MSTTQQVKKQSTGTARIVWGAILITWAVVGFFRVIVVAAMPNPDPTAQTGGIVGVVLFGAIGVALLLTGLNKRSATRQ